MRGNPFQCGTVYQLQPPPKKGDPWTETVLYIFKGIPSGDAATPSGGLLIDKSGNLYGATGYGGAGNCQLLGGNVGCGTVFELSPPKTQGGTWTETILYSFQGNTDGQLPIGDLVLDQQGNLYGSTSYGGGYGSCNTGFYQHCGTVFKLSRPKTKNGHWKEQVLYSFKAGKDGANPNGDLVLDSKGSIYGTTEYGGNGGCKTDSGLGCGTIFEIHRKPRNRVSNEQILHVFSGGNDGATPVAGLTLGPSGLLYGTTGSGTYFGLVFQISRQTNRWHETVLHVFKDNSHGRGPGTPLLLDEGNLYGGAFGGTNFMGVLFSVNSQNGVQQKFSDVYSFSGPPDGSYPSAALVKKGGKLYSITQGGGTGQACAGGCGTVFDVGQ